MGDRLVRMVLTLMGDEQVRADLSKLLRSDSGVLTSATALRASQPGEIPPVDQLRFLADYLSSTVVDRVLSALGVPDARMRAAVISSYLVGISTMKYVLKIEPLASASDDAVVALVGPSIQALLDPTRRPGSE